MKIQRASRYFRKILLGVSLVVLASFMFVSEASASEGRATLSNSQAVCEASSFWNENNYEITGRCDGLVYPFEVKFDHYYVWAFDGGRETWVRVDDVERGYFEGKVENDFTRLMITAEQDSTPRRPSEKRVMSGEMENLDFEAQKVEQPRQEEQVQEKEGQQAEKVDEQTQEEDGSVGKVVGRIFTAILAIIVVVIVLVVVGSLVFRKRGSVSG